MYAQIIVDVNSRDVDKLFTYAVPEEMELCAGMRVTAPFGPRTLTGMVVSVSDHTDVAVEKIRPLLSRIDDEPVVQPEMMQLAFWMRDTYRTTMAAALRQGASAHPPGCAADRRSGCGLCQVQAQCQAV